MIAIYWETTMNQPEVIINGRKQGASPKNGIYNKKTWYILKNKIKIKN